MVDDYSPTDYGIVPKGAYGQLSLPSEMVSRGLELAVRVEKQQDIEKYKKPVLKFPGLLNASCINYSRNGEFVALASYGKQKDNPGLVIWDVANRMLLVFPEAGFQIAAPARFFVERIPSDAQMGVTKETTPITEIRVSVTEKRYKPIGDPGSTPWDIYSVALSRCGDLALIGYGDGRIYRCNIGDGVISNFEAVARDPYGRKVSAIAISPDDRFFAECTGHGVRTRDTTSGREIKRFSGHNPFYNQLAFSDDGSKLLIAHGEQSNFKGVWGTFMTFLDLDGKQPPIRFGGNRIIKITAVSVFPDNQKVVSLEDGGTITVWNATNGDEISHWRHTEPDVNDVIHRKQLPGNLEIRTTNPIIWGLSSVAVSPGGRRILSGGGDNYMRLWTLAGHELWAYPHDSRVVKVAFLPDGRHALSGCWNGSIYLWELP